MPAAILAGPAGRGAAWQRACFGSRRSPVRIRPPRLRSSHDRGHGSHRRRSAGGWPARSPPGRAAAAGRARRGARAGAGRRGRRGAVPRRRRDAGGVRGRGDRFLVSAAESADRVAEHLSAVDAAAAAGVERIVYLSFMGAAPDAVFTLRARPLRRRRSGSARPALAHTFLRSCMYAEYVPRVRLRGGRDPRAGGRRAGGVRRPRRHRRRRGRRARRTRRRTRAHLRRDRARGADARRGGRDPLRGGRPRGRLRARDARAGARVAPPERRARTGRSRAG